MSTSIKAISPISTVWKEVRSRFLEGLAPSERESVLKAATPRRFPGNKILLNWLVPGDTCGGYSVLATPASYLLSTETVRDSGVLVWSHGTIRGLVARYPRLLDNGLLMAADYFAWYLAANVALTCHPARQRVAQVLVSLAKGIGQKVSGGVELDFTNEELANASNVSSFTASRILNEWQRQGLVLKSRGKILLPSPEQLFVHAATK
jgi:CRP/FNR family transcriptional regulator, nitrogen oxide reductase regulator